MLKEKRKKNSKKRLEILKALDKKSINPTLNKIFFEQLPEIVNVFNN